jgi:hypothetical protein
MMAVISDSFVRSANLVSFGEMCFFYMLSQVVGALGLAVRRVTVMGFLLRHKLSFQ